MDRDGGAAGPPVAGVLLAAGTSRRMGENKLLLEQEGESILRRAVRTALAAGLAPLVVVLGHESERTQAELAGLDCTPVFHPGYRSGVAGSLRAGIAALPATCRAAVVLLADMPRVTSGMIVALVERFRESAPPLVLSDYEGVEAPPTLFDRSLFAELAALEGDRGGAPVARRHRDRAAVLAWPRAALRDLDRPKDLDGPLRPERG